jgi:hypothetical protein
MRNPKVILAFAAWVLTLSLHASPAAAFGDPNLFAGAVTDGGGGAKFFTGSRAEGYTCRVCHGANAAPSISLIGLPVGGYMPGATYRVTIDWPDELRAVGLNAEATDFDGAPFGQLMAAEPMQLTAAERCGAADAPTSGQTIVDALGRRVLLVAACGQAQTILAWRAPSTPQPGLFSASIVVSNQDGSSDGDSVFDFSIPLSAQASSPPLVNRYLAGCAVEPSPASSIFACANIGISLVAFLLWRRRRGRRTSAPTDSITPSASLQSARAARSAVQAGEVPAETQPACRRR